MNPLIISCSHNPNSRSAILARASLAAMRKRGAEPDFLDLAEVELPFCDGDASYGHDNVSGLKERVERATGIMLASPVYNYDLNAAAKNLLELTGQSWKGKVVAFLCAAGGHGSYMSVMPFANSLMLDFRCVIVPRFVYATGEAFAEGSITDPAVQARLDALAADLLSFSTALEGLTAQENTPLSR